MANPTTNYSWPMPTSTDLVTDLPADFALFGQPVDTSLKALNPETTLGDISFRSSTSNTNTRLGIGTAGQVLAVSGGVPAWTTTADVTPLTTKGDLFTFTTVDARVGVGANNTVLTADSAEASGLKWATPGSGALTFITRTTFSSVASQSFDSIFSSTYKTYLVIIEEIFAGTQTDDLLLQMRYSGTTETSNTYYGSSWSSSATGTNVNVTTAVDSKYLLASQTGHSTTTGAGNIYFNRVGNSSQICNFRGQFIDPDFTDYAFAGGVSTARTYTGFLLKSSSSNITGTLSFYGLATS